MSKITFIIFLVGIGCWFVVLSAESQETSYSNILNDGIKKFMKIEKVAIGNFVGNGVAKANQNEEAKLKSVNVGSTNLSLSDKETIENQMNTDFHNDGTNETIVTTVNSLTGEKMLYVFSAAKKQLFKSKIAELPDTIRECNYNKNDNKPAICLIYANGPIQYLRYVSGNYKLII